MINTGKSYDQKTSLIKWLGIITMTIDHIGYYLFPSLIFLRIIGRIAFPCFLYTTVQGTKRTKNFWRYVLQLVLIGVVSIPVTPHPFNVLFALAIFAISMKYPRSFLVCFVLSYFVEYSVYGFLMGWTIFWLSEVDWKIGVVALLLVQLMQYPSIQIFAALALIPFLLPVSFPVFKVPKTFGYLFYPVHQLILILIR